MSSDGNNPQAIRQDLGRSALGRAAEVLIRILIVMAGWSAIVILALIFLFLAQGSIRALQEVGLGTMLTGTEWYPTSSPGKYGFVPLMLGSLLATGIDEPAASEVNDGSPYPADWSAARWMAHLARGAGVPVWGENSGQDDAAKMSLSAERIHANGFMGLMWAFESELYADPNAFGYATIDDYEAIIESYANFNYLYLPIAERYR